MKIPLSLFCLAIILYFSTMELKAQWKQVNLGPVSGKINTVAVIGSNVFAATNAGINRSTNNGVTWTSVNSSMTLCFASIGSNIFAGTSSGVIISTDDGNSWTAPNSGMPYFINSLAIKDTIIFAGTSQNGIFRSTNNGNSWTAVNNGLGDFQNEVLALAVIPNGTSGTNIYAGTAAGLCLSTDNGNNWSTIAGADLSSLQFINCITGYGSTIFVGTPGGIIRSTDNGSSWGKADTGLNYGTSIFSILVNNSNIFMGTTAGVYISTNDGLSWTSTSNGLPVSPSQVFSIAEGPNGTGGTSLYAGTNNGVYLSTNNGANWTIENNGAVGTEVNFLTGIGSDIFAVIKGSPIFVSTDYGSTWKAAADSGLENIQFKYLTATSSGLYAANYAMGIFMSSNNGQNWSSINGGVMDKLTSVDINQSGLNLVVSTYNNGIYFSSNSGVTWNKANGNFPSSPSVLSVIGSNIFAEFSYGMYLSTDNGENWAQINEFQFNGGGGGAGTYIGIVSSGSTLFTADEPNPIVDTVMSPPSGLYSSTDNGKTWSSFHSKSLPIGGSYVFSLVTYGADIFVAPGDVLFVSTDNGNNWNQLGQLLGSYISSVFVNDSSIFVGNYQGIWQMPLSDIISAVKQPAVQSFPKFFTLWQNYPNPFNPTTVIEYQLPKDGFVSLKVYDILGREVRTLVNDYRTAGKYSVNFDGSNLASGIYIYQLKSNGFSSIKKMVLTK